MRAMGSQITGVVIVYCTVCSGVDQRKHQISASLTFVRGIHQWPMNSPHKGPITRKMLPFDYVIMLFPVGYASLAPIMGTIFLMLILKWNPCNPFEDLWIFHFQVRCSVLKMISVPGQQSQHWPPGDMPHLYVSILHPVHDDVIKWKHFPRYCPFVWEYHRWILLTKLSALMFSLIYA